MSKTYIKALHFPELVVLQISFQRSGVVYFVVGGVLFALRSKRKEWAFAQLFLPDLMLAA